MIGYNPSHLNKNETLLEAFHRVEAYLKANPQYQVYQSSASYQEGTQEYALGTIIVPEGSTVGKGDVVLFSNVYYAVITAVSETTFSVETATNFRGAQGEQGPKGDTGATGGKGETGLPALTYSKSVTLSAPQSSFITELDGYNRPPQINDICLYVSPNTSQIINGIIEEIRPDTQQVTVRRKSTIYAKGEKGEPGGQGANGKDGNATLLYSGELSESITSVEAAQITRPQNRGILVKDILISTAASTFGAMAQVTALPVGVTTVDVSFIGTLESGGSSGVSDYNNLDNIPVINQDLTASGFTPTANTYYRHTGATTDTFTQGVIYLYDTAYHKLGESGGGGTTLNRYTIDDLYSATNDQMKLLCKIVKESKGKVMISFKNYGNMPASCIYGDNNDINVFISSVGISINKDYKTTIMLTINSSTGVVSYGSKERFKYADNTRTVEDFTGLIRCIYFNDTEIKL